MGEGWIDVEVEVVWLCLWPAGWVDLRGVEDLDCSAVFALVLFLDLPLGMASFRFWYFMRLEDLFCGLSLNIE